jgi:uncharacterized protein YwgA
LNQKATVTALSKGGGTAVTDREQIVAAVVNAAGGQLTGRVRLQKAVYLMERMGLGSGFQFEYHHYGPFSRDLDNAVADAKAFGLIEERFERRQSDGATYSVFKLNDHKVSDPAVYGELGEDRAKEVVSIAAKTNVTVLELAATIEWLRRVECVEDWESELRKRKGVKVQGGRLDQALNFLQRLDLG